MFLPRQALTQETLHPVGFHSLPVNWAQETLCTAKQVFVRTLGLPSYSESELRQALTSKILPYVSVLKLKSYFFLCTNIYSEYL